MQNNKKNIMYIFNDTVFGGAGQSLMDTLVEIKTEINPIVIIREDAMEIVGNKFSEMNIRCYKISFITDFAKIGSVNEEDRKLDIRCSYEAAMQLLPIIKNENIELIHINSSVSYFAAIAALMARIPYIWHVRELMEEHFRCEFLNLELKKVLFLKADKIITISDYVQKKYLEKYNLDTFRIYDGLNVERFKLKLDKSRNFKNTFLAAAMITPEKGQWDAIRAVEIMLKRGISDIQLIIVGANDESYVWALNKYIEKKKLDKNVYILPFQDDLTKLREKASYAITCSQNEALGRVTIEAMLAGNVIIGARSGATIEVIGENEERGFLYELHNSEALADTMIRAIQSSEEIKRQRLKEAQTYAENTFDSKKYCKMLIDLYKEVMFSFEARDEDAFLNELSEQYDVMKKEKLCESHRTNIQCLKPAAAFSLAIKWLEIKQRGHNLSEFFKKNDLQKIAIYGMADLGRRLYDELDNNIEVKYLLDRNPNEMGSVLEFVSLEDEKIDVDAIVVTVALAEKQVIDEIKGKGYQRVIGLSEILNSFK